MREKQVEEKIRKSQQQLEELENRLSEGHVENSDLIRGKLGQEYLSDDYDDLEQRIDDLELDLNQNETIDRSSTYFQIARK